ncbi:MAG TPA: ABC transporter permease [Acidimicrobiales bacterium]|nr:ABC transporter permease [Acidimicrobiales bacterium]
MLKVSLRTLLAHKWRLLTTFLAVALGVAFMGGVLVLTDTMNRTFDDLFADVYRDTDAVVRSQQTVSSDFGDIRAQVDASLLDEVAAADGVAGVDGTVSGYARIIDKQGEPLGDPAMGAPTFGSNWTENDALNPFDLTDGRAPTSDGEVVIDRGAAKDTGYDVGDTIPVQTRDTVDEYELVGIVRFGTTDSPGGSTNVFWNTAEAQRLVGEPDLFAAIAVVGDDGVSQDDLAAAINDALPDDAGVEVVTGVEITEETQSDIKQQLSFVTVFFLIFAIVALVVGIFVIYNSFSIIVAQRTREMALLRAVGARRRQVRGAVLIEAVLIGVVGSVLGFLAGLGLATLLGSVLQLPPGSLAVLPTSVAIAIVTGLIVTLVAAFIPAWRASRVPPLAAMRDVAVDRTGASRARLVVGLAFLALGVVGVVAGALGGNLLVAVGAVAFLVGLGLVAPGLARPVSRLLGAPVARLRGAAGAIARDNVLRNPRRTSATALALMIGVGLVAFFLVFNASLRASIDQALEDNFTGDFVVDSGTFGMVGLPATVAEEIGRLPDVAIVAPVRWSPAFVNPAPASDGGSFEPGEDTGVAGADAGAFELFGLTLIEGDADLGPGQVVINVGTAESEGLALGDEVQVSFLDDQRAESERKVTVSGIYDDSTAAGGIGDYVLGLEDWNAAVASPTDTQVFVQLVDGVSVAEAEPELERVVEPYVTAEVQSVDEYKDMIGGQLDFFLNLIVGLLLLAVFIAALGIANTIALSVIERTRELGLLRAVGMRRRQLRSAIRWEAIIISVFGSVLGLAFALLVGWGAVRALRDEGFGVFEVPVGTLIVLVVLAGLVGLTAALVPAWRASRMKILDAVSME